MRKGRIIFAALTILVLAIAASTSQLARASDDVVFASFYDQPNRVCLSDGIGGFTCSDVSTDTDTSLGNALGIFDDDEHLDVVFANTGPVGGAGEVNRVCFGDGLGGFACSDVTSEENASFGVAAGDLDVLIFTDGFESGDTSAWSNAVP